MIHYKMKVLQVCQRYAPYIGGIEEHVRNVSERLAPDFDVSVATTDPSGKLPRKTRINNVEIIRFRSCAPNEAYFFSAALRRYLKENSGDFDIVHTHGYSVFPSLYAAWAKGKNKLVFTPHYHGTGHTWFRSLLHRPYRHFGKRIFDVANRIVCVSNYEKRLVLEDFRLGEEKISVIPNGVDLAEFTNLMREKHDDKRILYVGRLERYKGVHHLIEVLPKLGPGFRLEIVGKGPYRESLNSLVERLCLENSVDFSQDLPRKELLQKYANADVFALLSEHEAFGISVAEALRAGTPCIVANTSALSEWVDGKNCIGIKYPIDLLDLADTIKNVAGKEVRLLKVYDWSEITSLLADLYRHCGFGGT